MTNERTRAQGESHIEQHYFSVEEAAEYLRLSKYTVYKLSSQKIIPQYKIGRRVLFAKADLEKYLQQNKVPSVTETARQKAAADRIRKTEGGTK
ncbi:helix-turn-helix domain-containing protein [Spirochaeta dissipatitropha]